MQSLSQAVNHFHEQASWFARAHELKLLVVRASGELRPTLSKLAPGFEYHHDNRSAWVVLADPHSGADDGWQARANRLLQHWEARRRAFAEAGVEAPALELAAAADGAGPAARGRGPEQRVSAFRQVAAAILRALPAPLEGLIVVLAPSTVEHAHALERELAPLLIDADLEACRFVLLLDLDTPPPRVLLDGCGPRAMACACVLDSAAQDRDIAAMLAQDPASPHAAGPKGVRAPARVDDPPPLARETRDAALRAAGVDPAFIDEAPALRQLLFGAALAMKQGRGPEAVRLQREARDLAERLGLHPVRVVCQVALGSYLSGLGQPELARRELESAAAYAGTHGLFEQASQAELALGLLHALGRRIAEAVSAYVRAAQAAVTAKVPLLAIESWRLAGQLAIEVGATTQGIACFAEAIAVAQGTDAQTAQASSASEVARRLAAVCAERGLRAQAASLEEQADRIEHGGGAKDEDKDANASAGTANASANANAEANAGAEATPPPTGAGADVPVAKAAPAAEAALAADQVGGAA